MMSLDDSQSQPRGRILSRGDSTDDAQYQDEEVERLMMSLPEEEMQPGPADEGMHGEDSGKEDEQGEEEDEEKPILTGKSLFVTSFQQMVADWIARLI